MKKSTKIIALISILAIVAAIFAVAAFAEGGAEDTTVTETTPGTYTPVAGSFDPTDTKWEGKYDGMTYGLWSLERAYLAGLEPDYWYTDATLTKANIGTTDNDGTTYKTEYTSAGYVPAYVHLFADINTESAQIVTGQTQALVLDLGGHTLTMKNGFRVGGKSGPALPNASLTIKNGKVIYESGQTQLRSDVTFVMENVYMTVTSTGDMYYAAQADYIRYTDCYLDIKTDAMFSLGYAYTTSGAPSSSLLFENTDIVYAEGITVPNLFTAAEYKNAGWDAIWNINFDKDSSISGTMTNWIKYTESARYSASTGLALESYTSTLNFEPGFTFGEGLVAPTTYVLSAIDADATVAAGGTLKYAADATLPVGDGTNLSVTEIAAEPEEVQTVGLYTAPSGAWNPLSEENAGNYPGISFATWASKQAYLDGEAPVAWYQDLDRTKDNYKQYFTDDVFEGVEFIQCYEDVAASTAVANKLNLPNGVRLEINLGGKTLTTSAEWVINSQSGAYPNSLFKMCDGKITVTGARTNFRCREDGTVIFDNVYYDATGNTSVEFYVDVGSELVVFEDSLLKLSPTCQFGLAANWSVPHNQYFIFKNTDVVQIGAVKPLFTVTQVSSSSRENNWTIIFDKDSSVTRDSNDWVSLNGSNKPFSYVQGLYFEVGCEISPEAMPAYDMQYSNNGSTANANTTGGYLEIAVIKPVDGGIQYTLPTENTIPTVSGMNAPIGREAGAFDAAAFSAKVKSETYCSKAGWKLEDISDSELKRLAAIEMWKPESDTSYAVWATESDYLEGMAPLFYTNSPDLLTENIATLGDGVTYKTEYADAVPGYVVLFANVENKTAAIYVGNTQKLTIDLNGCTVTSTAGFTVGDATAASLDASLKLINGNLVLASGAVTSASGTELNFEQITLTVTNTAQAALLDKSAGDVTYTDCTVNLENANAGFDLAGGTVQFIGTDINQSVAAEAPLFWVSTANTESRVFLDKTSTVIRDGNLYAGVLSAVENSVSFALYLEDGIVVSKNAVPDFTDGEGAFDVVLVASDLSSKYTDPYFVVTDGNYKLIGDVSSYAAAELDPENPRAFLQIWEDALDTGNAKTPFTKNDGAVIKIFRDTDMKLGCTYLDYDLTIDLNGKELRSTAGTSLQLGVDRSGYWEADRDIRFISSEGRGTLTFAGSVNQPLQARPGTNVYFENLDISFVNYIFNDGGAQLIHFKNCSITSPNAGKYIISRDGLGATSANYQRHVVFDGSTVTGIGIVTIWATIADKSGYVVTFMNGCTVDNTKPLIRVTNNVRPNTALPDPAIVRTLNIDIDTRFTSISTVFGEHGDIAAQAHSLEVSYYADIQDYTSIGTALSNDSLIFLGDGTYYSIADEKTADLSAFAYAYAAKGEIKVAVSKELDADDNVFVTLDDIKALPAGTTLTLLSDLVLDPAGSDPTARYADGLVFELSGNTLTFKESFELYGTSVTFRGGSLYAADVEGALFTVGAESLVLTLDAVSVDADALVMTEYSTGMRIELNVTDSTLELLSELITLQNASDYDAGEDSINVLLTDSKVKATALVSADAAPAAPLVHFTVSECFFSAEPTADAAVADVTLGQGERAMSITGLDGYAWRVTVFDVKLKASIFIESDFGIKFYIPEGTNITAITVAGVPYTVADITDTEVYDGVTYKWILVENILPSDAAEVIDITVVFTKDELSHTEDTGYSVIDYIKALLNSDKTLKLKQLGVAACEYVSAAYAYADKTNSDLAALMASEQYVLYAGDAYVAEAGTDDTSALAAVIEGAQLELNAIVKIRFNLVAGYTGTLVINGREFAIENGTYGGNTYVSLSLPAYELCDELAISADGLSGTYSLEKYAAAIASGDVAATPDEQALVAAFYSYCRYAEAYRALYEN